jgi:cell division septation protein DedD
MSELTHDTVDEAFHEIQLSGKQLVFLFMATTIVAVVIFLCGVQVGRGVKAAPADSNDAIASATVPSVARATPAASAATEPPPAEPPSPAKDTEEDLSYAKRLQADGQPSEKVKPAAAAAATTSAAAASTTPAPAAAPVTTNATATKESAPKTSAPPAKEPAKSPANGVARPGVWVVQVQALKDHGAAAALAQRLVGKGYPAFVLSPVSGAPSIYRVQVGRYNDRREAEQVARRLEKEEQFKPWISH